MSSVVLTVSATKLTSTSSTSRSATSCSMRCARARRAGPAGARWRRESGPSLPTGGLLDQATRERHLVHRRSRYELHRAGASTAVSIDADTAVAARVSQGRQDRSSRVANCCIGRARRCRAGWTSDTKSFCAASAIARVCVSSACWVSAGLDQAPACLVHRRGQREYAIKQFRHIA